MPKNVLANGEAMPEANVHRDTIGIKNAGRTATESALLDLEAEICNILEMAHITDHMLDEFVIGRHVNDKIAINGYEMDMLVFAWKDVASRAHGLKQSFYAAAYAEDAR